MLGGRSYQYPCVRSVTALTAHLNQAPPLQYDSYVLLPGPASQCAVACFYSHNPFSCLTISLCVCAVAACFLFRCLFLSLPPSCYCSPPPPHPHPHSFAHRLSFSDAHTRTETHTQRRMLCLTGSEPLTTVCLQKSSFISHSQEHNSKPRLFFAGVRSVLEFYPSRINHDTTVLFN